MNASSHSVSFVPIHVALHHVTHYRYDRLVGLSPHLVRLRPAPHCRTPILSYSLRVEPPETLRQLAAGPAEQLHRAAGVPRKGARTPHLGRPGRRDGGLQPVRLLPRAARGDNTVRVRRDAARANCRRSCAAIPLTPLLAAYLDGRSSRARHPHDRFPRRAEPEAAAAPSGTSSASSRACRPPEYTLELGSGSCRDSTWLLVQILRHLGLAARFVSGYLIQLVPDDIPIDGPRGRDAGLHRPPRLVRGLSAGRRLDRSRPDVGAARRRRSHPALLHAGAVECGAGHRRVDDCEVEFVHEMRVRRVYESPRVTKPYTDDQWDAIVAAGPPVDARLRPGRRPSDDGRRADLRLD